MINLNKILLLTLLLIMNNIPISAQDNNQHPSSDFVPQWSKEVVWYQIFPERFCNGDKTNDPTGETLIGSWPHCVDTVWKLHSWASGWYGLKPYEKKNCKDIWFNIQQRRYEDIKNNLATAAHLIHGSSENRFKITYCPGNLTKEEIESVNFEYASLDEMTKKYNPEKLVDGFNKLPDGEEIFYISNPALGLWAFNGRFV